jgi:transcriptional regulator with XRE-family HTH domain
MTTAKTTPHRTEIARKVRALRAERRLTQAELSRALGLSQGRYSEIERGKGSFTAEQFLELLRRFNVPASHFAAEKADAGSNLQNALARLGAVHLHEIAGLLPSEQLLEAEDALREVLIDAESPRQLTALAPVLVRHIDRINLLKLGIQFCDYGLTGRWAWLLENVLDAVRHELAEGLPRKEAVRYRRTELLLSNHLQHLRSTWPEAGAQGLVDILDPGIASERSLREVQEAASPISSRWGIATLIQPGDFRHALRAARVNH